MSLESFDGFDQGEGMSSASLEKLRERMKAAAAQIKQIKKEEKKQKQKEDELVKILIKFVKTSQNKELTLLISRALEQNIPANFILAVIFLSNPDLEAQVNNFLLLEKGESEATGQDLIFFKEDESMPLKIRIRLDQWLKELLAQSEEKPEKMLKNSYDIEFMRNEDREVIKEVKTIKVILIQLLSFVLRDFLEQNEIDEEYEKLKNFSKFMIKGILTKTRENYENRKLLG
jgi:hypothetical protein